MTVAAILKSNAAEILDEVAEHVILTINRNLVSQDATVLGFAWKISHGSVSNSHSKPKDGVLNWDGKAKLKDGSPAPRNYSGWSGRVWIRYSKPISGFGSNPFYNTLTYTGTGGFGSYGGPWSEISNAQYLNVKKLQYPEPQVYSWDYQFFDSDFPNLETALAFDHLSKRSLVAPHRFEWQDSKTVEADRVFLSLI